MTAPRWLVPAMIFGTVWNLCTAADELLYPTGWWSYLFAALSLLSAGLCASIWRRHHNDLKK